MYNFFRQEEVTCQEGGIVRNNRIGPADSIEFYVSF